VVGSGAGGAMVARVAAEAGVQVLVLEAGPYWTPGDMSQREEEMFPKLFWDAGTRTTADKGVKIHQGKGVGGSTLHNINLCKRIPDSILDGWRLRHLPLARWHRLYEEVEALLSVSLVTEHNRHNQLLQQGCARLGWRGGPLQHNRTGCIGSGFCEIGCAYDAKNNALKVLLPRAIEHGAEVLAETQAVRVDGHTVHAVAAGRPVTIEADRICLAASATGTPALLDRSGFAVPAHLRLHPGVVVAGEFDAPVYAWRGIPQSYECTEWLDFLQRRLWIIPAFAHPMGTATFIPRHGPEHAAWMARYAHLGVLTAMLHDETAGRVRSAGDLGVRIDYWPNARDRAALQEGLRRAAELLFAAGAQRIVVPATDPLVIERGASLDAIASVPITRGNLDITSVHPMASVPMGDDPDRTLVDSAGRVYGHPHLFVADASLFPSSIGVPPQLSTYAVALHVAQHMVGA
jgi:choline dehydrogenase-like flavoprotein